MDRCNEHAFGSRRVFGPVLALLRQGLSPEGIALSLAFGLAAGIFPVIGATTLLGLGIGAILRLNQPALQLANWLAHPLQLILILPLVRLGEWVAGVPPTPFAVSHVVARVASDPVDMLPFVVLGFYRLLLPALRAAGRRVRPAAHLSTREAEAGTMATATPKAA